MTSPASSDLMGQNIRRKPVGAFLDGVPGWLYVLAHVGFLAGGLLLWIRAVDQELPFSAAVPLYAVSQLGFIAYFAGWITMKAAVLAEQTLVFALITLVVFTAT